MYQPHLPQKLKQLLTLAKVRTPLAHNRDSAVQRYALNQAKAYCEEILARLAESQSDR